MLTETRACAQAALALIRMLHKEPDLLEHMAEKVVGLLKDRSHGVLNSALQLITEVRDERIG